MMTAILSCTADDLYSFNLPFAVYSWNKMGIDCLTFTPIDEYNASDGEIYRLGFALGWSDRFSPNNRHARFRAPKDKIPTYAQCSRLYAVAFPGITDDILITADADMCVFNGPIWRQIVCDAAINIVGSDLVPDGQVPMCYIAAPAVAWRNIMQINGRSYQECLDDLLGPLEAEHFRGNYWAKDQETAFQALEDSPYPIIRHLRAKPGTQFATHRADRDGWQVTPDIIDAHLPRPGYTSANFTKIVELFHTMYPKDDLLWMHEYFNEYTELLNSTSNATTAAE